MNYKTILIAMFIMAMALIGPSVALNPATISVRPDTDGVFYGDMSDFGRLVDIDADYWLTRADRGEIELLGEDGTFIFYVNPDLAFMKGVNLYFHDTLGGLHTLGLNVYPIPAPIPDCDCSPDDPDGMIIWHNDPVVGEKVTDAFGIDLPGNGDFAVRTYQDGVQNSGNYLGGFVEVFVYDTGGDWSQALNPDQYPTGWEVIAYSCYCPQ